MFMPSACLPNSAISKRLQVSGSSAIGKGRLPGTPVQPESVNDWKDGSFSLVRYGTGNGTDAVRVTREEIRARLAGKGPRIDPPVEGRNGGAFSTFGDYSVDLFEHIQLDGDPPSRALFDMAAVAIVKNPAWATPVRIPAPRLEGGRWVERPGNPRTIVIWEDFDREAILADFFASLEN